MYDKVRAQKKKLARGIVCFPFHNRVARRSQRLLRISKHHSCMPRNDIVTNFVRFIPAVLQFGKIFIEQYTFLIRQIERL